MTDFGTTLREAREKKGLTISQIAEQTHLLPQIVEDLENEDFHRISAPIYGRGFVKLYCETVGLEPKPLIDEFMAILNGEREPAIRLREVELPPEPAEPTPPPPPSYVQPELGNSDAAADGDPVNAVGSPPLRESAPLPAASEDPPLPEPERQYHPDYAQAVPGFGRPLNFVRLAVLAGAALAILAFLIWGGRALYRASMGVTADKSATTAPAAEPATKAPAAKTPAVQKAPAVQPTAKMPRAPKDVAPLYID